MTTVDAGGGRRSRILEDVRWGMSQDQKQLPSKYFYDMTGSELFEAITQLPEYYLTRTETELIQRTVVKWVEELGPASLVELGAGSARKTRILLDAMEIGGKVGTYAPVDIAGGFLRDAAAALGRDYPSLTIELQIKDITTELDFAEDLPRSVLFALLGSTLGNFHGDVAVALLRNVHAAMRTEDRFILGADLRPGPRKSRQRLEAAYNDDQGTTAEFNLNILRVINREAGTDFDLSGFEHRAYYDEDEGRIEMHLVAKTAQVVHVPGMGPVDMAEGESIRTELSCKYDRPGLTALFRSAGLDVCQWCEDQDGLYTVVLASPV